MPSRIGLILFLLYVVFQVVTLIMQGVAKRKEQERIRQEAERRRIASGQMRPPASLDDGTGTGPSGRGAASVEAGAAGAAGAAGGAGAAARMGRPADDLAARRRAQLEELRQRRAGRRPDGPTVTVPGRASMGGTSLPAPGSAERQRQRELEQQQQKREDERRRRNAELEAMRRREQAEQARAKQARERAARRQAAAAGAGGAGGGGAGSGGAGARVTDATPAVAPARAQPATPVARQSATPALPAHRAGGQTQIMARLRHPGSLRQAIVLKELLDLPIALR